MKFQLYQPQAIHELGKRTNQEDSIYPLKGAATLGSRLFIVCDGMGGHEKGEVASAAVCQGMSKPAEEMLASSGIISDDDFQRLLNGAFSALDEADVNHEGTMGTTMTFMCLHNNGCLVAHIGDSRIYHLRPATGQVLYRSRDHSLVQQLYELGEISYNEMATSPRKNIILKAMQPHQEEAVNATLAHITDIKEGDYFYLCSDGMLEQMEDDELMDILRANCSDTEKAQELIRRTAENADNHSAYLVHIKGVEREEGDQLLMSDEDEARAKNKALNDHQKDTVWDFTLPLVEEAPATIASQPLPKKNKLKKFILPAVLLVLIAGIIVALLLLCGGKKSTDNDTDLEDDQPSTGTLLEEMSDRENKADEDEDGPTPASAKPYLEKKATDKALPVEPDPMPQSTPAVVVGSSMDKADEHSSSKGE